MSLSENMPLSPTPRLESSEFATSQTEMWPSETRPRETAPSETALSETSLSETSPSEKLDDAQFQDLWRRARDRSEDAARELFEKYGKHVIRCVRHRIWRRMRTRFDSQDFGQQVWASVLMGENLPEFKTSDEFIGFLTRLAERKVYLESRRQSMVKQNLRRETPIDEQATEVGIHPAAADPTPSAVAVYGEEYERLIGRQEPEVREVAQLRIEGNTFREIANSLEIDERTARRFMNRVKRAAQDERDLDERDLRDN